MSKEIYTYTAKETSEDTRSFTITSKFKLTYEEVCDIYQDASFDNVGEPIAYPNGVNLTYHGTSYGSSDNEVDGDFADDEFVD